MKRAPVVASCIIMSSYLCSCASQHTPDLSSPRHTVESYYAAFEQSDVDLQAKTVHKSIKTLARNRYDSVHPILQGYRILQIRKAKDRLGDTYELPEDAVEVYVKEVFEDSTESNASFVLQRFDSAWLIVSFVSENEAEFPPNEEEIQRQAERMLGKPKGK